MTILKYFFVSSFFVVMGFLNMDQAVSRPGEKVQVSPSNSPFMTPASFRAWVETIKKELRGGPKTGSNKQSKPKNSLFLNKINKQLQKMKVRVALKGSKSSGASNKNDKFLLNFQLSSFQELFPLLLRLTEIKNQKKDCVYLKQKIVHDIYPNYEKTQDVKLPYSHKELQKILQIICTS